MAPRKKSTTVDDIKWTENNNTLTWGLLGELSKKENHVALHGVQSGDKTLGLSKTKAHKNIASVLFPAIFVGNEETLGCRVKSKIDGLHTRYKKELLKITATGGGLGGDESSSEPEDESEQHSFIGADGPDASTSPSARNIWEKIIQGFPFFPEMHKYLCGHPNTVPPVVMTGVGPSGRPEVAQFQSIVPPTPSPASPTPSDIPAVPVAEAQATTSGAGSSKDARRQPKPSSFSISQTDINRAKSSIQRVPKRSFEDILCEATSASLKRANDLAESAHRLEKHKLVLDRIKQLDKKRDQAVMLYESGIYTKKETRKQLKKIEDEEESLERTIKKPRVRSPSPDISSISSSSPVKPSSPIQRPSSPVWDIEKSDAPLNPDDIEN